jgi:hypothetical protein
MPNDPNKKIRPDVLPYTSEITRIIGTHNRALDDAKAIEERRDRWVAGELPSVTVDDMSGVQEEIDRQRGIAAASAAKLDRMGYDPDDPYGGRPR